MKRYRIVVLSFFFGMSIVKLSAQNAESVIAEALTIDSLMISTFAKPIQADSSIMDKASDTGAEQRPTNDSALGVPQTGRGPLKWYSMISNIPADWVDFSKETFTQRYVPGMIGMAVVTAVFCGLDEPLWQSSHQWYTKNPFIKRWSDIFVSAGDGTSQFAMAGLFGVYGLVTNDDRALRTGSQIIQAVLSSGSVVQVLKHVTGRESPFVSTVPAGRWDLFPNQIQYHKKVPHYDAFPSGHVTTSMATVVVIAENYPEYKWISPVGYGIVACIGVSMVNTGIHWYSDYPLAIFLGYAFGKLAAHPDIPILGAVDGSTRAPKLTMIPTLTNDGGGVSLSLRF